MSQVADVLGVPLRTAERQWAYARAWLYAHLRRDDAAFFVMELVPGTDIVRR